MRIILLVLSAFCFIHIIRDYFQIKYGYKSWFTKFAHFWHHPEYEVHGMIIFAILGFILLYLGLK